MFSAYFVQLFEGVPQEFSSLAAAAAFVLASRREHGQHVVESAWKVEESRIDLHIKYLGVDVNDGNDLYFHIYGVKLDKGNGYSEINTGPIDNQATQPWPVYKAVELVRCPFCKAGFPLKVC